MLYIGCHLSSSKGFAAMGRQALELGANTFQFFTRNPRGSRAKDLDPADAAALRDLLARHGFGPIVAHAPYTLNLCGAEEKNRIFARETMAGKGSEVGGRFEELRAILDRVELSGKVGVCLDTCHVSDGGYDIVHDLDGVLTEFDSIIGLRRLKAIHLNDSKNPPGSRKDRHACLGEGTIGLEALERIVRHPALKDLPFCLETPNDLPGYAREIALMREMAEA